MAGVARTRRRSFRVAPPRRTQVGVWVLAVVFFGGLLALAQAAEEPLDDPDPAFQRPGFLDVGDLPAPAPDLRVDMTVTGTPTVVLFERSDRVARLCRALDDHTFASDARAVVVTPTEPTGDSCADQTVVVDAALADEFGLRNPRAGGPPVGYAVVDRDGRIRYRTLDPAVATLLDEIDTIIGALP